MAVRLRAPQRREQLMEVAARLFARRGFDATTTAAIAEDAGVTEPILYRHFKNKQELFIAILRTLSQRMIGHWEELVRDISDPAEQIRRVSQEYPDLVKKLGDAYRVLHGALATSRDRKVQAVVREHFARIEQYFLHVVTEGQKAGIFRQEMDPKVPAWLMINVGLGYSMIGLNLSQFHHFPVKEAIEFVIRGMRP